MSRTWRSYSNLAWTEPIVGPPEEYREETELYSETILKNSTTKPKTLLHLGCGAGMNDYTFKMHFEVTGVDISPEMLKVARKTNPEVKYAKGDMRDIRLKKQFDAVTIPDSIGYMTTIKDLGRAINAAYVHLKPGGVLLIVAHMREDFKENNFVYSGSRKDVKIIVFENNTIVSKTSYEATIIYLIRRKKKLEIDIDKHTIGLFDSKTWNRLLLEKGFKVKRKALKDFYSRFLLEEGEYPQVMFICQKDK